jgi:SHS2 domain-containing protein
VSGDTLDALFREAALAFTDTITDLGAVEATSPQLIQIASPTIDDLLVDWLEELLYRFEVRNLLVADVDVRIVEVPRTGAGWRLEGILQGETADSTRHRIKVLIKGITYHQLEIQRVGGHWETSLVFDI